MSDISNLKNIGPKTTCQLHEVGIHDYDALVSLGTERVFQKVFFRFKDEMNFTSVFLYAIEGAIEGIHWNEIDPLRKDELKTFFRKISAKPSK